MLHVIDTAKVPPGGRYRYVDAETGQEIAHPYFEQVLSRATKYRIDNNLPIPSNWEDLFENNVCQNTSTCPCEDESAFQPPSIVVQASNLARSVAAWAASGFALVSDADLELRRSICQGLNGHKRCRYWRRGKGFGRCGKCGCATSLKTPLKTETCPMGYWPV